MNQFAHLDEQLEQYIEPKPQLLELITAKDLQARVFPPIVWLVDDILPEGLTLFCGRPKFGKSWAALDLAVAVAEGGQWLGQGVEMGSCLYLALEDNQRRLQSRQKKIRPVGNMSENLEFATACPRLEVGGAEAIERWLDEQQNPRLVIVDTLAAVKPTKSSGASDYQADYAALRELHRIANERQIALVVVHHVRKAASDSGDVFDTVSGSTGLTGAADAVIVLTKRQEDGGAVLYGRGRDIQEFEYAVEFDVEHCRWKLLGDPSSVFLSDTRKRIIEAMNTGAQTPAKISDVSGLGIDNVKQTVRRMVKDGQALRHSHGCYRPNPVTKVTLSPLRGGRSDTVTEVTCSEVV